MMNVVAGYDPKDPFSAGLPVPDYLAPLDGDIRGFRLGLVKEIIEAEHLHPEVRAGILDAAEQLRGLGAVIEEVSIPLLTISGMIIGAAGPPRAADHWHTLKERPNDFDVAVRRSFLLSGLLPNAISQRALQVRALLRDQVLEVAEEYDALIGAALNQPAPTIEEVRQPLATKSQATARLRRFPFTWAFAVAGLPVISVPAGFTSKALPFALQIAGKRFDEVSVLRVAHAYEQATPWQSMNPPLDALISA
jgi:aspartyl-tRNA(Asn)/glutamyl-tRNA(Gln) amidotransferase subunit A